MKKASLWIEGKSPFAIRINIVKVNKEALSKYQIGQSK